ncbi:hypothetical protein NPIL_259391 [Nephila pilipes]|uniref:Uncharacterized protein n=1 Tax=Nephila pilipes TaxID=299642 RepID=A0A8X6UKH1_NEPPI|nr:hypothetical protein NPIL_259391 [Nephila pilipes]
MARYLDSENEMNLINERSASCFPTPSKEEDTPCTRLQRAMANIQRFSMIKDTRLSNMKIFEKSIFFLEDETTNKMDHQLYRDATRQLEYWVNELGSISSCELADCPFHDSNNSSVKKISPNTTLTKSLKRREIIENGLITPSQRNTVKRTTLVNPTLELTTSNRFEKLKINEVSESRADVNKEQESKNPNAPPTSLPPPVMLEISKNYRE